MDDYVSNELLVESTAEIVDHLDHCSDCAAALDSRIRARTALKSAVERETVPPELQNKIRHALLRDTARGWQAVWAVAAVVLFSLLITGAGLWYLREGGERASADIQRIFRMALDVRDRCPANAGIDSLGDYDGIVEVVGEEMPSRYGIAAAHRCMLDGRLFVQVVLEDRDSRVFFVMTEKAGERLSRKDDAHALDADGVPVYNATIKDHQIAVFETRNQLAFLVSDLPRDTHLQLTSSIAALYAPLVRSTLQEASRAH